MPVPTPPTASANAAAAPLAYGYHSAASVPATASNGPATYIEFDADSSRPRNINASTRQATGVSTADTSHSSVPCNASAGTSPTASGISHKHELHAYVSPTPSRRSGNGGSNRAAMRSIREVVDAFPMLLLPDPPPRYYAARGANITASR